MTQFERIGRFEVLDRIGGDAFSLLYSGNDPFEDRPVEIRVCVASDDEYRWRFLKAAEDSFFLRHHNISRVLEFGSGEPKPYLVQEVFPGTSLKARIYAEEPVEDVVKLFYLLQLGQGLQYAHEQGVLHRQISPEVIRVGAGEKIKLSDFGVAQLASSWIQLQVGGAAYPAAGYILPEVLAGMAPNERSEVFGFGATAYELLAARPPFSAETLPELVSKVLNETPAPLTSLWPECPEELEAVIHKCLSFDPRRRYARLGEVLEDLSAVLPIPAEPAPERSQEREPLGEDSQTVYIVDPAALSGSEPEPERPGRETRNRSSYARTSGDPMECSPDSSQLVLGGDTCARCEAQNAFSELALVAGGRRPYPPVRGRRMGSGEPRQDGAYSRGCGPCRHPCDASRATRNGAPLSGCSALGRSDPDPGRERRGSAVGRADTDTDDPAASNGPLQDRPLPPKRRGEPRVSGAGVVRPEDRLQPPVRERRHARLFSVVRVVAMMRWYNKTLGIGLLLGLALQARPAAADFRDDYKRGIEALERGQWSQAATLFRQAAAERPEEKARLSRSPFSKRYLPHFYLGEALLELDDCVGALTAWAESERQGVVTRLPEYQSLIDGRDICRRQAATRFDSQRRAEVEISNAEAAARRVDRLQTDLGPNWPGAASSLGAREADAEQRLRAARSQLTAAVASEDLDGMRQSAALAREARQLLETVEREAIQHQAQLRLQQGALIAEVGRLTEQAETQVRATSPLRPYPRELGRIVAEVSGLIEESRLAGPTQDLDDLK